jgi:RNA polymerase sigma factor (sigma-70 family)
MDFDAWKRRPGRASLSALLESVEPRVYRICRRVLRDAHDAEEAKQEVLLEIASGVESLAEASHFDRWVGKVAFRTALDRRRMRLRRTVREHASPGRSPTRANRDDALHESMSRLEDEERELLIERYFDRRTLREMGKRRGISAVAVRKRIEKAREMLRKNLGGVLPFVGALAVNAKSVGVGACALVLVAVLGNAVRNWIPAAATAARPPVSESARIQDDPIPKPLTAASLAVAGGNTEEKATRKEDERSKWTLEKLQDFGVAVRGLVDRVAQLREKMGLPAIFEEQVLESTFNRHYGECVKLMREGAAGPEFTELAREIERLFAQAERLRAGLQEHSSLRRFGISRAQFDPVTCIDYLSSENGALVRWDVRALFTPFLIEEIHSEETPAGPLFKKLLSLSQGGMWDKVYFFSIAVQLNRSNRTIAQVCFRLLQDPEGRVREAAMNVLACQAGIGNLKQSISERCRDLQGIALTDPNPTIRSAAIRALAVIATPEVDEFLVQQLEGSASSLQMVQHAHNLAKYAPRILDAHEHRFVAVLNRTFDAPFDEPLYLELVRICLQLPKAASSTTLRRAATLLPSTSGGAEAMVTIIRRVEAGEAEAVLKRITKLLEGGSKGIDVLVAASQ